ncbi:hypothetical protein PVAG01_10592 [Phlyctema vagabunda]|uniref:MMS19 nucleotide excision repair protein n=1 Tax=Phlyctema vagabunda TaxID=108571 RepID=A0ABR4P2R5_9HELO
MEPALTGGSADTDPYRNRTVSEYMQSTTKAKEKGPQETDSIVTDLAGRIELGVDGRETFTNFLRELQPYISQDASLLESSKAIELLEKVLRALQPEIMNKHDISSLVALLSIRLRCTRESNYRANIKGTVQCLDLLSQMSRFLAIEAYVVSDAILSIPSDIWSQQVVDTRVTVYEILHNFLDSNRISLQQREKYGRNITDGVTTLALQEKDPSCLNVVFPLYQMLGEEQQSWGVEEKDFEKIWESFVRYYPIKVGNFGKKAWDSSKPEPPVLKELLLNCFVSSSVYAQWAFPRLLDMLDQNSDISADVKKDVFYTLKACVQNYDRPTVEQWSGKLWDSLKFEVLNGENEEFIAGALGVIKELANSLTPLYSGEQTLNTTIPAFFVTVVNELHQRLLEPSQRFTVSCGRVVGAIASANWFAFQTLVKLMMGALFVVHQTLATVPHKHHMMQLFNSIIAACSSTIGGINETSEARTAALHTFKAFRHTLIEVYFEAMLHAVDQGDDDQVKYRVTTIEGLSLLFAVPASYERRAGVLIEGEPVIDVHNFLSDYEKGTIVESLSGIVLSTAKPHEHIFHAAIEAMRTTAIHDPAMFVSVTIKNFAGHLPDCLSSAVDLQADVLPKLDALTRVSCAEVALVSDLDSDDAEKSLKKCRLFHTFSDILIKKLEAMFQHKGQIRYATMIVAALYHGMMLFDAALSREYPGPAPRSYNGQPSIGFTGPYGDVIMRLYRLCIVRKKSDDKSGSYMGLRELPCGDEVVNDQFLETLAKLAATGIGSEHTVSAYSPLSWRLRQRPSKEGEQENANDSPWVASEIWALFDNTSSPTDDHDSDSQPFNQSDCVSGPGDKCSVNILSVGLLAGARRGENLNIETSNVAIQMMKNALSTTSGASFQARISFIHATQLLVNKFGVLKLSKGPIQYLRSLTEDAQQFREHEADRIYQVLAYTTSAALLSYDPSTQELVSLMLSGLEIPERNIKIARSFRILLAPSDIINENNFCVKRPLAYGLLYRLTVPTITDHLSGANPGTGSRNGYLIALAGILTYMPLQILKDDAARIVPVLLAGTDVDNPGDGDLTKNSCMDGLIRLIPEVPGVIEEHVDSIINRMIERAHNTLAEPSDAPPDCRVQALDCLKILALTARPLIILQRKPRVMRELDTALDDVSRTVRRAAERTKMAWFNITEDDVKEDTDDHAGHNH